jgi:hypothetical protein
MTVQFRHCERSAAGFVIASEARQSTKFGSLDCHVTAFLAMTVLWLSSQ